MKSNIYKLGCTLLIISFIVFSCRKDINEVTPDQGSGKVKSMSDIKASSDFNWKTTQNVELELSVPAKSSLVIKSSSGVIFQKALLTPGESYKTAITIPNYMQDLTFVVNGVSTVLKIENNRVVYSF
ncbi:MAG: hypothetical protein NTU51_06555 [Bacteroidetes bacterium]|nr:hypothetical protein [Bacteroidota bacterium]